jgi:hypothetical protein
MVVDVTEIPVTILKQLGVMGLWLKAVGIIVILWIFFQVFTIIINAKRIRQVYQIHKDMKRMEKKLDLILKKR